MPSLHPTAERVACKRIRRAVSGRRGSAQNVRQLLLIRLLQETTISSVPECPVRRSRPAFGSSSDSLLMRRRAASIWRPAAGPTAFDVRVAATAGRSRCARGGVVNAPTAGTKCR